MGNESSRFVLYTYNAGSLSKTDLVRFYYALKGRDGKSGIIKLTDSLFLAKKVLLVKEEYDGDIKDFLQYWKLPFIRRKISVEEEEIFNEA